MRSFRSALSPPTGFRWTPFARSDGLSDALGFSDRGGVWVKDDTGNVAGSHKARQGGGEILGLKKLGSACDAPGVAIAQMVDAIANGRNRILPAVAVLEGEYGRTGIAMGVPCVLAGEGIARVIELPLDAQEQAMFDHSADQVLRDIANADSQTHRVTRAIDWLNQNFNEPLRIEDLARVERSLGVRFGFQLLQEVDKFALAEGGFIGDGVGFIPLVEDGGGGIFI